MKCGWWIAVAMAALPMAGCALMVGTPGSGISQRETRAVDTFDEVEVNGAATVHVRFGGESKVELTTDDNLLPLIDTRVDDGRLVIEPREPIRPSAGLVIEVTTQELARVEANGSVDLHVEQAKRGQLEVELNGACDFVASGQVDQLTIDASGASDVDTRELRAQTVKFSLSGAGSGQVYAARSLTAEISGAGRLKYYGSPSQIKQELSGVGSISPGDAASLTTPAEAVEDAEMLEQLAPK